MLREKTRFILLTAALVAAIGVGIWNADMPKDAGVTATPVNSRRDRREAIASNNRAAEVREIHRLLATANPVASGELGNDGVIGLLHRLAERDPVAAAARATALEDPLLRNLAVQEVASKWILTRSTVAIQWVMELPVGPVRKSALQGLMAEWTALAWAAQLAGEGERNQIVQTVLAKVAESGTLDAADFVLTLPAGAARTQSKELVLGRWSADDA